MGAELSRVLRARTPRSASGHPRLLPRPREERPGRPGPAARTGAPGAEAARALGVPAAAAAVLAPVVAGRAGAAARRRPVAGLHGPQGLACGRERHSVRLVLFAPAAPAPGPSDASSRPARGARGESRRPGFGNPQVPPRTCSAGTKTSRSFLVFLSLSIIRRPVRFEKSIFMSVGRLRPGGC